MAAIVCYDIDVEPWQACSHTTTIPIAAYEGNPDSEEERRRAISKRATAAAATLGEASSPRNGIDASM